MTTLAPETAKDGAGSDRVSALNDLMHAAIDFVAAISFLVGSVLFFFPAWETTGIWLFVFGSMLFAANPTMKIIRAWRRLATPATN